MLPRVLATTVGRHRAVPGPNCCRSAGPTATCCRRIEHESGNHRLKFPNSSNLRTCRRLTAGAACTHLLARGPHESFGHRLEPQDSPWSEDSGDCPTRATNAAPEVLSLRRRPACLTKAPFYALPTPRLRQLSAANLVVQLDMPRLQTPTKSWPDWNVSLSERTHGTALERVRAGQCPVPLAAAGATQRRHRTGVASSPGPFGGRQAEPAPTGCRGGHTNSGTIDWSSRILRGQKTRACTPQGRRTLRKKHSPLAAPPALRKRLFAIHPRLA